MWRVDCRTANALDVARGECQGLSECELHANNDEFGPDPCGGTKKYLQVNRMWYSFLFLFFAMFKWRNSIYQSSLIKLVYTVFPGIGACPGRQTLNLTCSRSRSNQLCLCGRNDSEKLLSYWISVSFFFFCFLCFLFFSVVVVVLFYYFWQTAIKRNRTKTYNILQFYKSEKK